MLIVLAAVIAKMVGIALLVGVFGMGGFRRTVPALNPELPLNHAHDDVSAILHELGDPLDLFGSEEPHASLLRLI